MAKKKTATKKTAAKKTTKKSATKKATATKKKKAPSIMAGSFAAALRKGDTAPGYVVVGEEGFLRTLALEAARNELLGEDAGPSYTEFDGRKTDLAPVLDELRTRSFFGGGSRLVVVQDAGPWGKEGQGFLEEHAEGLVAYFEEAGEGSTLLLVSPKFDKRRRGYKQITGWAPEVVCDPLKDAALSLFVRERAEHWGRPFAKGAEQALLDQLGGQQIGLDALDGEIRKLAGAGEGPVEVGDIRALVAAATSEDSFAIVSAVGRGQLGRALELVDAVFRDGMISFGKREQNEHAIAPILIGTLRWDVQQVLKAQGLLAQGVPSSEALRQLKVWRDKDAFLRRVRGQDRATLGRAYAYLRQADGAIKRSANAHDTVMALVIRLCGLNRVGVNA